MSKKKRDDATQNEETLLGTELKKVLSPVDDFAASPEKAEPAEAPPAPQEGAEDLLKKTDEASAAETEGDKGKEGGEGEAVPDGAGGAPKPDSDAEGGAEAPAVDPAAASAVGTLPDREIPIVPGDQEGKGVTAELTPKAENLTEGENTLDQAVGNIDASGVSKNEAVITQLSPLLTAGMVSADSPSPLVQDAASAKVLKVDDEHVAMGYDSQVQGAASASRAARGVTWDVAKRILGYAADQMGGIDRKVLKAFPGAYLPEREWEQVVSRLAVEEV